MIETDGHQWVSYATDDAPARGEQDDEIALDETVRVGLVGLGRIGRGHAANLAGRIPGARLVRVVDAAEDVASENAAQLGDVEWSTGRACRDYVPDFVERFDDAYREEIEHFVHVVRSEAEPRPSEADADAATVLARAAERSHREERTVWLNRRDQGQRDFLPGGRLERRLEGR